ncbi:MAG: alpha-hydroxy-acid oxidizing protein [Actinomycetia bacterium]|nr:alpha-hydroxy-acid oxidizing protein [Actinomycetes bacterium]
MMTHRQIPKWTDLAPLLSPGPRTGTRRQRSLTRAASISDLRRRARRRTPRAVFDYVDGAADDEISLARSRSTFRDLEFQPHVLRDVSHADTATTILGRDVAYPFGFAPTGYTRMMHHEGESAVARVAERVRIPYALSTLGTTTPEDVAAAAPGADRWFQLYVWRDRDVSNALAQRAHESGFRTLILTVDLPVGGARLRDVRNGMTVPPSLTVRTALDGAMHPNWWLNFLTTEPLSFASLNSLGGNVADSADRLFDPALNFEDLVWLREQWDGPIVVKGIQSVEDARRVVDLGADAVILSNHGGRQLDRSPTPLLLLQPVLDVIGSDAEVYVDGGIMNGGDIVAAVALGARAAFVGRAYLYGIMAGGQDGVQRAADILTADIERTMKLLGVQSLAELNPDHVRLP